MIFRIVIAILLLIVLEFIFYKILFKSANNLWQKAISRKVKFSVLIFLNLYPIFLIFNLAYAYLFNVKIHIPSNTLLDWLLVYPFWFHLILIVQILLLYILYLLLKLLLFPLYKKISNKYRNLNERVYLALFLLFVVYIPFRIIFDYHNIDVSRINYIDKNLPDDLNGIKIALISDMQNDRYTDSLRLKRYIQSVNELEPDIILMGGDMITGSPEFITSSANILSGLKSRLGVYSCVGDHDNW
ncbi:MAG: hypothetical protein D6830_02880, partial [Ignavibacteria bacterium]